MCECTVFSLQTVYVYLLASFDVACDILENQIQTRSISSLIAVKLDVPILRPI